MSTYFINNGSTVNISTTGISAKFKVMISTMSTGITYTHVLFDDVTYNVPCAPRHVNKSGIPLHVLERQYALARAKHNKKEMQRLEKLFANY